jgi:hypothetical protein
VALWMAAGVAASVWLVRRLDTPLWWLLFPPLFHSMWNGNPQSIALALLVSSLPVAAIVAVSLKLYAAVPLVVHPRTLALVVIVLLVSLPVLPWQLYVDSGFGVGDHLQTAWNGSAWRLPVLLAPALVALWVLRGHGAQWLAVPTVWPATQFYYVAMAMPWVVKRPGFAALFAVPAPLVVPLVAIALAGWHLWVRWQVSHGRPDPEVGTPVWLRRLVGPVG